MAFLNSILKNSSNHKTPFEHWELNQPLTDGQVQEIVNADIANPIEHNLNYDGTRAIVEVKVSLEKVYQTEAKH